MTERVAVVTGVSKGLGASLAAALIERGIDVVGVGRSAAPELSSQRFRLVVADLADIAALPALAGRLFDELAARAPATIAVINNAAVATPAGTVGALDADELARSFAVNLYAPTLIADAFVRAFSRVPGDRRLINVSSGAAVNALAGAGAYCIGKAGLEMLTMVVADEQGADGIAAITIRPGIIDTPMQAFMRDQAPERVPSVAMFRDFHETGALVPPAVTAVKIVERLVLAPIESGRTYSYAEL